MGFLSVCGHYFSEEFFRRSPSANNHISRDRKSSPFRRHSKAAQINRKNGCEKRKWYDWKFARYLETYRRVSKIARTSKIQNWAVWWEFTLRRNSEKAGKFRRTRHCAKVERNSLIWPWRSQATHIQKWLFRLVHPSRRYVSSYIINLQENNIMSGQQVLTILGVILSTYH